MKTAKIKLPRAPAGTLQTRGGSYKRQNYFSVTR
jgi:hypothetical protein